MARPGISQEEILAAIDKIIAQGEKLTVNRVRDVLGNRGTPAIIARILKERNPESASQVEEAAPMQQSLNMELDLSKNSAETPPPAAAVAMPVMPVPEYTNPVAVTANPSVPESAAEAQAIAPQQAPIVAPPVQSSNAPGPVVTPQEGGDARREKLGFKKRQYDNNHRHRESDHQHQHPRPQHHESQQFQPTPVVPEVYYAENLENMSDKELLVKFRRLEIYLNKEQSRREAAEKMAREAKEYAEVIKEQIGQRISELRESLEETIDRLKAEARELKANAETDLKFYREQLEKANKKIIGLINGDPEHKA